MTPVELAMQSVVLFMGAGYLAGIPLVVLIGLLGRRKE